MSFTTAILIMEAVKITAIVVLILVIRRRIHQTAAVAAAVTEVHTYNTQSILGENLNETHVLVGESGGLTAIYDRPRVLRSALTPELTIWAIETEHGHMVIDPERVYEVLDNL